MDYKYSSGLKSKLSYLERNRKISYWSDSKIKPGERWLDEIDKAMNRSKIAVFLVSANFLNSDFCMDHEVPNMFRLAKEHGVLILWIAVTHIVYEETIFATYQSILDPKNPLSKMRKERQEEAYTTVVRFLLRVLTDMENFSDRAIS